ncbi:DUF892 family protein [Rhizobium populisoli]|uniref:DUF892 family protein n=1 Tax=Rhizobium populisoli TaxID=2859785 RepID=UPI0035E40AB2
MVDTLPKMEKAAKSKELKAAFTKHLAETKVHGERLEQVFKIIGAKPEKKTCDAILDYRRSDEIMKDYFRHPGTLAATDGNFKYRQGPKHCL